MTDEQKAALAEPRLPKVPSREAIEAMRRQWLGPNHFVTADEGLAAVYRALRAHLLAEQSKPATKTVEVWRVEYTFQREPRIQQFDTQQEASYKADCLTLGDPNSHHACIRVTGPHKQEVPA